MKRRLRIFALAAVLFSMVLIEGLADASPPILPPSLWVMDADGGDHVRLMRETHTHHPEIEWSPDGRYILMEGSLLTAVPVDGSRRVTLTDPDGAPIESAWSPDGATIVFSLVPGGSTNRNIDIYSLDVESRQVTRLTTHPRGDRAPAWSPDSSRLAFVRRGAKGGLFVMDADGTNVSRLIGGIYGQPLWSPDGSWIATADGTGDGRDIWVTAQDGTQVANITHSKADELEISWSPDSERLAFLNYYKGSINVIDRDGTDREEIFHRRSTGASSPMWSPDGERILFEANDFFTIRPDGTGLRNLTPGSRSGWQPVYSPDGATIAYLRR